MRIAVFSDVHGNLPGLEAVLADARDQGVDAIATTGDLTSGVWSEEVITRVLELASWAIAGNHEGYYLSYHNGTAPEAWRTDQQWGGIRWCYNRLSPGTFQAMAALPEQTVIRVDGAPPVRLLHGSPRSALDRLYPDANSEAMDHYRRAGFLRSNGFVPLDAALDGIEEPVVVCGHTHVPWIQDNGTRLVVNAGAVGGALNGDWRAHYAILTWTGASGRWCAEHRAVPYDLDRVREGFSRSGYLAEGGAFARAVLLSLETALNWPGYLLRHVHGWAREHGWDGVFPLPDELWYAAVATFDWGQ